MNLRWTLPAVTLGSGLRLLGAVLIAAGPWVAAEAEPTRVRFPKLDGLVHYGTLHRGEITEHFLTTPAAIAAIKQGRPAPVGTPVVLADFRGGKPYRYFVMEKGQGWGADYVQRRRTGDWQFQWFWPNGSINTAETTERCQSCHSAQAREDYLFTGARIPRFNGRPIE